MVIRGLQHIAVILFLLSFTNQAENMAGKAILPIRLVLIVIATVAMYFSKKSSIDLVGETGAKNKSSWLIAGGIIAAAFLFAILKVFT